MPWIRTTSAREAVIRVSRLRWDRKTSMRVIRRMALVTGGALGASHAYPDGKRLPKSGDSRLLRCGK
jgi:hypothetical protein